MLPKSGHLILMVLYLSVMTTMSLPTYNQKLAENCQLAFMSCCSDLPDISLNSRCFEVNNCIPFIETQNFVSLCEQAQAKLELLR